MSRCHAHTMLGTVLLAGCLLNTAPTPNIPEADRRVLFIGNSLTYTNDMPRMVKHLADATGKSFAYGVVAQPNFSLEEHWATGIASVILAQAADIVVMQQGPSSVPANQAHLKYWTEQMALPIRASGGTPALLMVWPATDRLFAFDAVRDSYYHAAAAVDGLFLAAGEAWRAAWARDPQIPTYSSDGFHPSAIGSMAVALTVYAAVFDAAAELQTCTFPAYQQVSTQVMQVLCGAVLDALEAYPPNQATSPRGARR